MTASPPHSGTHEGAPAALPVPPVVEPAVPPVAPVVPAPAGPMTASIPAVGAPPATPVPPTTLASQATPATPAPAAVPPGFAYAVPTPQGYALVQAPGTAGMPLLIDLTGQLPGVGRATPATPAPSPATAPAAPPQAARRRSLTLDLNRLFDPLTLRKAALTGLVWFGAITMACLLVWYLAGSLFSISTQRSLTQDVQLKVQEAVGASTNSLYGYSDAATNPQIGDGVGLVQVPRTGAQWAVAEGADPQTLRGGPGHVPGTSGLGQPGNSVVVGRAHLFGADFADLGDLAKGDQLVVTTTQGRSTYVVDSVRTAAVPADSGEIFGPSADDRLTLLTSAGAWPFNGSQASVVVAKLKGQPFRPTPGNGRAAGVDGHTGDAGAWPLLLLVIAGLALLMAATTAMYRRWSKLATYVVTTPALLGLLVAFALVAARLVPAWA